MNKDKMRVMADRVFRDMAGGMAAGLAFVGTETGLFRAMQGRGAMTESEVVNASGLQARYVEEWLKGMVAASYLDYDAQAATYTLPDEHAFLLASDGTDHFMGGMFAMLPPLLAVAPRVATACRDGGGVPFADYAPECRHAIDHMNRGNYEHRLVDYWLKQLPEVSAALAARRPHAGCRLRSRFRGAGGEESISGRRLHRRRSRCRLDCRGARQRRRGRRRGAL